MEFNINEIRNRMERSIEVLKKEFSGLRTGRASVGFLEPVQVEAYGSKVPISQVGNIGIPEPRLLTVQVWDSSLVSAVENAILSSNLGLNPMTEGNLIRLPIPDLTEERRKEIVKVAGKYSEDSKIILRNIRRDAIDKIKSQEKNKEISKDQMFVFSEEIQSITDEMILKIDGLYIEKEKDILQV